MDNAFDVLKERGFIEQSTNMAAVREKLGKDAVSFYIGFDPTSDSLTAGHFLTIMAMVHMQRAGHRPIVLVGGGTTLIGDPTGKTDMRKMLTLEEIESNTHKVKMQLSKFIDFSEGKAILVNNADWLLGLQYIPFIRDVGIHFSVNRMLAAECYKSRLETGLSFLEFNYMLMQSYDFLALYRQYGCTMQLGGNDQWSNILGGVELIRKVERSEVYGLTLKLLTTSEGKKMGKTEAGAVWLDPEKTSPYEFFQYWRNVEDANVSNCLHLLTLLPLEKIQELSSLKDEKINEAKEVLAFELTKMIHGEKSAKEALDASKALFSGEAKQGSIPSTQIAKEALKKGIGIIEILECCKLIPSRGEGRRLISQGGIKLNGIKVEDINQMISERDLTEDGDILLQKGKKSFHRIVCVP